MIDIIGHFQLGQHIAREEFPFGLDFLAAFDFGNGFGRDFNILDQLGQAETLGVSLDRFLDLVFKARISVNDIPACHANNLKICWD